MNKSESIKELATALANFQGEIKNVKQDGSNPFYKSTYATLENVISTIKPILSKHGLSFSQFPTEDTGLTTILMHVSGEWIMDTARMTPKDASPQSHGSMLTYLRRYTLSAILGVATEADDDGNAASGLNDVKPKKPYAKPAPSYYRSQTSTAITPSRADVDPSAEPF